jgi:hypothetical protein
MFKDRSHWADKAFVWIAPLVILVSAGGGAYYYFRSRPPAVEPAAKAEPPPAVPASEQPTVKHPVPAPAQQSNVQPLPALSESDVPVRESLQGLLGAEAVQRMLVPQDIVRRIVVTVDNLPRQKVAVEKRPLKPLGGATPVVTEGDLITLDAANFARYAPYVSLVQGLETQRVADLYFQLYPLFQQAYEDLGYPGQYFNDRLVEAIDSLIATPDVSGRIQLRQPRVFYEFADPRLEALPAGQKLLLRMGRDNAAAVKGKLRELRRAVTEGRDPPGSPATDSP